MKHNEWSMKAQWYARWMKHNLNWQSCELVTPYGYGIIDSFVYKPRHILRLGFIWQGREYQKRLEDTKPFSRLRAVRIANQWIRGIAERSRT